MRGDRFRHWEIALLAALCVTLCWTAAARQLQRRQTQGIIRLQVIARSDGAADQAIKLSVRDAAQECLAPLMAGSSTLPEARKTIAGHLAEIESAARAKSAGQEVAVSFGPQLWDTANTGEVILPAGVYDSLRITLDGGKGHNWWGVVFPQLTPGSGAEPFAQAVRLNGEDGARLISAEGEGREYRLLLLEWLKGLLGK